MWLTLFITTGFSGCNLDLNPQPEPPGNNGTTDGKPNTAGGQPAAGVGGSAFNVGAGGSSFDNSGAGAAPVVGGGSNSTASSTGGMTASAVGGAAAIGGRVSAGGMQATGGAIPNGADAGADASTVACPADSGVGGSLDASNAGINCVAIDATNGI